MPKKPTIKTDSNPVPISSIEEELTRQSAVLRERRYLGKDLIEEYMAEMRISPITLVDELHSRLQVILTTLRYVALITDSEYQDYITIARNIVKSRRSQIQ